MKMNTVAKKSLQKKKMIKNLKKHFDLLKYSFSMLGTVVRHG